MTGTKYAGGRVRATSLHAGGTSRSHPESTRITGTVAEWEAWSRMAFPESGEYVVPGALALVRIDRERDVGEHVEPNVWVRHDPLPA